MYEGKGIYMNKVNVGNNVVIGGYAIVFPGAEIGDNAIIAANSVVPKDRVIPPNTLWLHGKAIPRKKPKVPVEEAPVLGGPLSLHKKELVETPEDVENSNSAK